jgi:hypothetical protein
MNTPDTTQELEVLFPDQELVISGETVLVKPLKFGQLPKAIKLLKPVSDALQAAGIFALRGEAGNAQFALDPAWPLKIVDMLAVGGEDLLQFLAFAVGKPRAWLDTLDTDDGVKLVKAVFEINADFFVRRVFPMFMPAQPETAASPEAPANPEMPAGPTSSAS